MGGYIYILSYWGLIIILVYGFLVGLLVGILVLEEIYVARVILKIMMAAAAAAADSSYIDMHINDCMTCVTEMLNDLRKHD